MISQILIVYSNHSIFMKLDDVMNAIHPINSFLLNSTNNHNAVDKMAHGSIIGGKTNDGVISTVLEITDDGVSEDGSNSENNNSNDPFNVGDKKTSYDYRECTSPESNVPWPLEGTTHSKTSDLTCGLNSDTPFSAFFRSALWKSKFEPLIQKCDKMAVFGVAFGGNFVKDLDAPHVTSLINATDLIQQHGRCFFILTTESDVQKNQGIVDKHNGDRTSFIDPVTIGHNILIPLPDTILPYKNPRRNVKLLKYVGQSVFQYADHIVWQDAKFFRDDFVSKLPTGYDGLLRDASASSSTSSPCVTTMGLPVHKITVGLDNIRNGIKKHGVYHAQYEHHCQTIIAALTLRPNVTDSSENLIRQCDAYLQHVYQEEGSTQTMSQGLIDSAFIIWNHKTQQCRDFSSAFRCTIVDQIQCHSDRDQVSIPFAMYKMGVSGMYRNRKEEKIKKVDGRWDPRIHDLDFVVDEEKANANANSNAVSLFGSTFATNNDNGNDNDNKDGDPAVMIRVTRSSCHWYFSRLGNCRTDLTDNIPTLALLVAGSAKRYIAEGIAEHLIKPLFRKQNTRVDYYLMLSVKQGLAYRSSDVYMKHQTFDSIFDEIVTEKDSGKVTAVLFNKVRNMITLSGANVGGIHIQPQPMKLDPSTLRKRQLEAKKARPKEDSYFRFPTLDLRPEFRRRTAVTNRNLFKLYLGLQKLWDKHLVASETYVGVSYDYVMVLREDVLWLKDFNLQKLIATNPDADAYVLSCDMRDPPMIANEYNDHGIVIKRNKAHIIGRYFDQILRTDLEGCHKSVEMMVPTDTGCNSGMLLYWIMNQNNVTVQPVSQSVFPIERVLNLSYNNTREICIHRYCQSMESPLKIPDTLRHCRDLEMG